MENTCVLAYGKHLQPNNNDHYFIKKLRDPSCDVASISTTVQDGGQFKISNQNISRNKADIKNT